MSAFAGSSLASPSADGLQSRYDRASVINFVTDCGADPTGATDCTAALNAAVAKMIAPAADPKLPSQSTTLFVPRGRYFLNPSAKSTWATVSGSTPSSFSIIGAGADTTIFEIGCLGGIDVFKFTNANVVHFQDLSFVGTIAAGISNYDCQTLINCQGSAELSLERVKIGWISSVLGHIRCADNGLRMKDVFLASNMVQDASSAIIWGNQMKWVQMDTVRSSDIFAFLSLNGYTIASEKNLSIPAHVNFNDSGTDVSSVSGAFRFINCFWDEDCLKTISIKGGPTANIRRVSFENCVMNPPVLAGWTTGIHIENVDALDINGFLFTSFNDLQTPILELVSVGSTKIRAIHVPTSALQPFVTADSGCGYVEFEDCLMPDPFIHSAAALTTVKSQGKTFDVYSANGTIPAGALAKQTGSGPTIIATTDTIDVVLGAARQAVQTTTIAAGSNGAALPQASITVASTTGFPAKGSFVLPGLAGARVFYTSVDATHFLGCTGGSGTLATGQVVSQGSVAISRPGSPVTLLSDGAATIVANANVGISAATAGRVKSVAAAADRLGMNTGTATIAASADAAVPTIFSPFKA